MGKTKLEDVKQSLLRENVALRFWAMLIGLALIVQLITPPDLLAQETGRHKIIGTVISATDDTPLPGANIKIKGTSSGTITDLNGDFSVDVDDNDILEISFIGYIVQEIAVAGMSSINVKLEEDVSNLEEVVVIGYGAVKREDVTGSVSSVKGEDLLKTQPVTVEQALQGKVAGMVIQQTSGQPGGGISVQVRGITAFDGGQPLYVIDGVRIKVASSTQDGMNPLAGINPSEIESIDVLKDASATAIYGSEATNGVILITTKRGKNAAPKISYQFTTGFQQLATKLPVLNLREHAAFLNARAAEPSWNWDAREEFANPDYLGEGTDWQKELFRNAPQSEHSLSVSGGNERTQYFLSGTYTHTEGIALGSDFKRLSFRLNIDNKTTDWLKIGTSIQLVNIDETVNATNSNVITKALQMTPDIAVRNVDGSWGGAHTTNDWVPMVENPLALALLNKDEVNRKQAYVNAYAEITFAKGLVLKNTVGGNFTIYSRGKFNPTYEMGYLVKDYNDARFEFAGNNHTEVSNYLTYTKLFAEKYNLSAMIGHESQLTLETKASAERRGFPTDAVQTIGAGDPATAKNDGEKKQRALESYFGRVNFAFDDKYLLTGNARYDGSSMYSEANRWILSYSGALAWKINNEEFLKNAKFISELKLRLGYGLTNREGGRPYAYASTLTAASTGFDGVAMLNNQVGNPNLKWEQTNYSNIGLDGAFLNWRFSFSVDFYLRRTDDLAMQISLPMYSGTAVGAYPPGSLIAPYVNIGSMENKGFDFRISSTNIRNDQFTWKTDLTVSHNENKVIKLNAEGASIVETYSKTVAGRSLGEFYGYVVEGVYATPADFLGDAENGIAPHARPVKNGEPLPVANAGGSIWYGDLKFKDVNGDGIIDERDQEYLGSPIPQIQLGLSNTFTYKNFDLSIFFNSSYGNKIYNATRKRHESPQGNYAYFEGVNDYAKLGVKPNGSASNINDVYVINADTKLFGLRNDHTNGNDRITDQYVEDGSFIKCKSVTLGYTFSKDLLQKVHVSSLRIYATATNLYTFTNYSGMDPEIGAWNPLLAGIDDGYYPQPRVVTFGVNISL